MQQFFFSFSVIFSLTGTYDISQLPSPAKSSLSGWPAIEDYLQKHDAGMVKDYSDDIDTLLVFVSLVSTVYAAYF